MNSWPEYVIKFLGSSIPFNNTSSFPFWNCNLHNHIYLVKTQVGQTGRTNLFLCWKWGSYWSLCREQVQWIISFADADNIFAFAVASCGTSHLSSTPCLFSQSTGHTLSDSQLLSSLFYPNNIWQIWPRLKSSIHWKGTMEIPFPLEKTRPAKIPWRWFSVTDDQ